MGELDNGTGGGGDYITREEWIELAQEGALVCFRIIRIEEPTLMSTSIKKEAEPVVADVLIVNGTQAETVYRAERIISAGITNTLRTKKVKNAAGKSVTVPRPINSDVAVRMGIYKAFGREHAGANPCGPDEFEKVKALFETTKGDPYTHFERLALASVAAGPGEPDDAPATSGAADDDLPF